MAQRVVSSPFKLHALIGVLILGGMFGITLALLRQLSVFNTFLGLWIFLIDFLGNAAVLLIVILVLAFIFSRVQTRTGSKKWWIIHYVIVGLAIFASFTSLMNDGLGLDVKYSTFQNKAATNYLNLQYLNGTIISTSIILVVLFMISDPRVSKSVGDDGHTHFYMHSKLLGLLRLLWATNLGSVMRSRRRYYDSSTPRPSVEWDIGSTPDHPVISSDGKLHWNDKFRISSIFFIVWTIIKFLVGLGIATTLANDIALRYSTIQNYLIQTNDSWLLEIQRYFMILGLRLAGNYQVPPTFGIDNVFTFEVYRLVQTLLLLTFIVISLRLALSVIANAILGLSKHAFGMARTAVSQFFIIISIIIVYAVLSSGLWVYDVGTPFILWTLILGLLITVFLAVFTRTQRIFHFRMTRIRALVLIVVVLLSFIILPSYGAFLRAQSGQYINYQWNPAYVPTIQYTRWSYAVDSVNSSNLGLITTSGNQTSALSHIRIFTADAARLNMKPLVGVNWMSITDAPVDIVYINGTEYWVSILQLVEAGYQNDPDVWRTQHLLLTHSEKVLAVNGATTQIVDMSKIWNLTQTPQIYYGQGGLWQNVDEVYLNIPKFNETHLTNYVGPSSYNGPPDYTYQGFWLYWKFFWQGRFDFANGDYGNIKALEYRDVDNRVSNILLPNMVTDPDAYPVVDNQGNIYLLHWIWVDWKSPSDFADYPDHEDTSILRLFGTVLTNLKTGQMQGYLYNNTSSRNDYVTSFYRSMYPQWNQPMPTWLLPQLRYPETYFNTQQSVYNFYFQTDPLQWQRNVFLESTEDTRFIIIPINGNLTWAAVRLVEIYQSPSKNLAGMYIAPAGRDTGKVYLIKFPEGTTVLGPESAISAVATDPTIRTQLTLHSDWTSGNILLYSINGKLIYVIPYYGSQANLTVPVMVAVVDASTKQVGSYFIKNPNSYAEVQASTTFAVNNIGISTGTQNIVNGTLVNRYQFEQNGNTRWIITINNGTRTIQLLAKAETLSTTDIYKINSTNIGSAISFVVDNTTTPYPTIIRVQ